MAKILQIVLLLFGLAIVAAIPFLLAGFAFATPSANVAGSITAGAIVPIVNGVQEIRLSATPNGYNIDAFTVKKGIPVRILFSADQYAGCGRQLLIPDFGINKVANVGQETPVEFTPDKEGTFPYRCSMNMFRGKLTVVA